MGEIEKSCTGSYLEQDGADLDRFRFSSDAVDRAGHVVVQRGIDTSGYGGGFFWSHDAYGGGLFGGIPDIKNVLGAVDKDSMEVRRFSRSDGSQGSGLEGLVRFAAEINPRAEMAKSFVRAGILGKTSIGFKKIKAHREIKAGTERLIHDSTALLEISLVPIPMNDEAERLIRSMAGEVGMQESEQRGKWRWNDDLQIFECTAADSTAFTLDGAAVLEMSQEMQLSRGPGTDAKGVSPSDVSRKAAPEGIRWSALSLSDFSESSWESLSASRKSSITGHFAWAESRAPATFGGLKLGHHRPSDGAVVFRGVSAAMGALNGARAPLDIPDRDRRAVHSHLASHYRQFNREAPELRSTPPPDAGADIGLAVAAAVHKWGREERLARAVRRAYSHSH